MCGFVGVINLDRNGACDISWLAVGNQLLRHRGPDAGGLFSDNDVGLASRRLRIHDIDQRADQPMSDPSGRYVIVLNGAIFNYLELKSELQALGYRFNTQSDTEVAMYALAQWGRAAFVKFDGMFAIAFYDLRRRRLLIGRDKLGIKPLYIHEGRTELLFSSEVKPLFRNPRVPRRLNARAVPEFVAFQTLTPPATLFDGIDVLRPGHGIEVTLNDGPESEHFCYWCVEDVAHAGNSGAPSVEEALEVSLRRCWNADRKVGVQLSGGIDSSLLMAISNRTLGHGDISTYSVIFDDAQIKYYLPRSEEKYIRVAADEYGGLLNLHQFNAVEVQNAFAEAIWYHEAPLNGASTCLYMLLARAIHNDVTVLITGEGADDIFLGYFADWNFTADPATLFKMFVGRPNMIALFGENGFDSALASRLAISNAPEIADLTHHGKATVVTVKAYLHGLLARHDRMFMSHGIEGRPPFCTDEMLLARFALQDVQVQDGKVGKLVLKQLAEKYFDRDFVYRKKIGFSAPFGDWCASPKWWRGYVDATDLEFVDQFADVAPFQAQQKMAEGAEKWSGQNLNMAFAWMNLRCWHRIFIESPDPTEAMAWQSITPQEQPQIARQTS